MLVTASADEVPAHRDGLVAVLELLGDEVHVPFLPRNLPVKRRDGLGRLALGRLGRGLDAADACGVDLVGVLVAAHAFSLLGVSPRGGCKPSYQDTVRCLDSHVTMASSHIDRDANPNILGFTLRILGFTLRILGFVLHGPAVDPAFDLLQQASLHQALNDLPGGLLLAAEDRGDLGVRGQADVPVGLRQEVACGHELLRGQTHVEEFVDRDAHSCSVL